MTPDAGGRPRRLRTGLLGAIRFYQRAISPALPPRCRFYPTCSAYAVEAIERHGAARGIWLSALRLIKCAPWHPGGYDPLPEDPVPEPGREPESDTDRGTDPAARPHRATPATRRTTQQEAGVA